MMDIFRTDLLGERLRPRVETRSFRSAMVWVSNMASMTTMLITVVEVQGLSIDHVRGLARFQAPCGEKSGVMLDEV